MPYLSATVAENKAEKVALDVLSHFFQEMQEKTRVVEEEEEGEDLCNCEFSLAYGMLLHLLVAACSCLAVGISVCHSMHFGQPAGYKALTVFCILLKSSCLGMTYSDHMHLGQWLACNLTPASHCPKVHVITVCRTQTGRLGSGTECPIFICHCGSASKLQQHVLHCLAL